MSEYPQDYKQIDENKRPTLLVVLSVLSLMVIASGLFSNLLSLLSGPLSADQVQDLIDVNMPQVNQLYDIGATFWGDTTLKIINMVSYTNANFYMDRMINIVGYSIGLFGVLNMLKGVKLGFHFYIIYNLISLFGVFASVPNSEIPGFYFGFFGVISLVFIYLYSKTLPWMKK